MKALINRLVHLYFEKGREHWNTTILVELFEDDEERLLDLLKDYYENVGKLEKIEVENSPVSEFIDLTVEYEDEEPNAK